MNFYSKYLVWIHEQETLSIVIISSSFWIKIIILLLLLLLIYYYYYLFIIIITTIIITFLLIITYWLLFLISFNFVISVWNNFIYKRSVMLFFVIDIISFQLFLKLP